jgi:hypothetical protein
MVEMIKISTPTNGGLKYTFLELTCVMSIPQHLTIIGFGILCKVGHSGGHRGSVCHSGGDMEGEGGTGSPI